MGSTEGRTLQYVIIIRRRCSGKTILTATDYPICPLLDCPTQPQPALTPSPNPALQAGSILQLQLDTRATSAFLDVDPDLESGVDVEDGSSDPATATSKSSGGGSSKKKKSGSSSKSSSKAKAKAGVESQSKEKDKVGGMGGESVKERGMPCHTLA